MTTVPSMELLLGCCTPREKLAQGLPPSCPSLLSLGRSRSLWKDQTPTLSWVSTHSTSVLRFPVHHTLMLLEKKKSNTQKLHSTGPLDPLGIRCQILQGLWSTSHWLALPLFLPLHQNNYPSCVGASRVGIGFRATALACSNVCEVRPLRDPGSSTGAFRKLGTEQRGCVTFHLSSASDLFREKAHCRALLPSLPQQGSLERLSLGLSFKGSQGWLLQAS